MATTTTSIVQETVTTTNTYGSWTSIYDVMYDLTQEIVRLEDEFISSSISFDKDGSITTIVVSKPI